jgi:hypothetical protein
MRKFTVVKEITRKKERCHSGASVNENSQAAESKMVSFGEATLYHLDAERHSQEYETCRHDAAALKTPSRTGMAMGQHIQAVDLDKGHHDTGTGPYDYIIENNIIENSCHALCP